MVTEMAGGFQLLLPAGVAVMIAYLLQGWLSLHLRYRSLYEGQVPTRDGSPAHYMENIHLALRLLGRRDLHLADSLGHLDLLRLMRSRIQFDLPGKKELGMAEVAGDSRLAGQSIGWLYQRIPQYEFEIIAILRREHVLLPHRDTIVQANDRVILITSPPSLAPLSEFLIPIPQVEDSGVQLPAPDTP